MANLVRSLYDLERATLALCRSVRAYVRPVPKKVRNAPENGTMNNIRVIVLKPEGTFTIVDADCFPSLNSRKWQLSPQGYVMRRTYNQGKRICEVMHRTITNAPSGYDVDHINGIRRDNRRSNLRICTRGQNLAHQTVLSSDNTSGVTGVSWSKQSQKWEAYISKDYKKYNLGLFVSKDAAIAARQNAAQELYGEFASTV